MNSPVTYVSAGFQFTGAGPEYNAYVHLPNPLTITFPDIGNGVVINTIPATPALVLAIDGTTSDNITINRISNSWLLCARKDIDAPAVGQKFTETPLLIVQEYLFPTLDSILGGDQNYAILGRVLHHQILPFQNV